VENIAHLETENCQRTLNLTDERERLSSDIEKEKDGESVRHMPQFTVNRGRHPQDAKLQRYFRPAECESRTANCELHLPRQLFHPNTKKPRSARRKSSDKM